MSWSKRADSLMKETSPGIASISLLMSVRTTSSSMKFMWLHQRSLRRGHSNEGLVVDNNVE
jgi:hypothetical protein